MKIGFIGLGLMGRPMALNLMAAGHTLFVYARNPASLTPLTEAGASAFASPCELAPVCDVLITIVSDTSDVREVLLGDKGVAKGARPALLVIDMSTISPKATKDIAAQLAKSGVDFLDAPVSGGQAGACAGTLSIMVGGTHASFVRALPLFQVLGKHIVHIGEVGTGQIAKAANQIATGAGMLVIAEALHFASKNGADPEKVRDALLGGSAKSALLENHGRRMLDRNFTPGFKSWMHQKDLKIVLDTAHEKGLFLPATSAAAQAFNAMQGMGLKEADSVAIIEVLERLFVAPN